MRLITITARAAQLRLHHKAGKVLYYSIRDLPYLQEYRIEVAAGALLPSYLNTQIKMCSRLVVANLTTPQLE